METNYAKFLQDSCKNYPQFLQESSKNFARIIQDPSKILARSINKYPTIIQESCKYYPRMTLESCSINLRIMQDVVRCGKIAFFCLPSKFQKLIARCVQSILSVHVFLKIELYILQYIFSFKTTTQHSLVRPWGKPTSPEMETERERKREQFVFHLY